MDTYKNFAVSTVATPPSPATSGTSLTVQTGHGSRFPTDFTATVVPAGQTPTPANSELVRVSRSSDTFTLTRAYEGTTARSIVAGDLIYQTITASQAKQIAWQLEPGSMPPDTAHSKDDEFNGSSLDAKWSWRNQATTTATLSNSHLLLSCVSNNFSSIEQVAPTGDFTVTIKLEVPGGYHGILIGTAAGNQIIYGYDVLTIRMWRLNSGGGWSSTIFDGNANAYARYLRMIKSGTTVSFWYSQGGNQWTAAGSNQTIGAGQHIVTLDRVGIGGGINVGQPLAFDFFRITEP